MIVTSLSVYMGCFWMWLLPAEKRDMSSRFGASEGLDGRAERVTRMVTFFHTSAQ